MYHDEYIPKEFLPTFNNFVMESFLYKIDDLSDNFIIGCDDFFFINPIEPDAFFRNDVPVQYCSDKKFRFYTEPRTWTDMANNSLRLLADIDNTKMNPYMHLFEARNKAWEKEWFIPKYGTQVFDSLQISKFRHKDNILPTVFADAMRLLDITVHDNSIYSRSGYIRMCSDVDLAIYKNYRMVCINDTGAVDNFQVCKNKSIVFLDSILPDKSSFELTDNKEIVDTAKTFVTA